MLMSVGKLSSIGEMLTIKLAASDPPGELQTSSFDSLVTCFHCGGTVHDIPCWSHLTVWPPANACVCAAVGVACSASPPLSLERDADWPGPPELFELLSLFVKLQSDSANPSTSRTGICFIGPHSQDGTGRAVCFYSKTGCEVKCFVLLSKQRSLQNRER